MTENERLNQKLRDIITGKYKSPSAERKNFFATDLGGERKLAQDYGVQSNSAGTTGAPGTTEKSKNRVWESTELFPGTDKLFTVRNSIVQNQVNSLVNQAKRNDYYSNKYKDTPKTYEGYMKNAQYVSEDERKWLEEQAEKYATAEDYKKEAERAQGEYNYLKKLGEANAEKAMALKVNHKSSDLLENTDKITGLINKAGEEAQRYSDKARLARVTENNDYYEEKYKDTPKTYEDYMKNAQYVSDEERQWLESKAEEFASSEDYRKEADKASAELKYLERLKSRSALKAEITGNADSYNSGVLEKIDNAEEKIKEYNEKAEDKEYEEKTKDILEGDALVRSIIEQYYVYRQKSKQNTTAADEAVRLDKEQNEVSFTPEQERGIVERFNNLRNEGYDPEALYTYYDRMMQEKAAEENLRKIQQDAINNPVGASAWSVADNLIGSIGDAGKYIGAGIAEAVTGEKQWINTKDTAAARVETVRSTVSDMIGADIDNKTAAGISQFLYQQGMDLADFGVTMPLKLIPGVGNALQFATLMTRAGTSQAKETYENTGKATNALGTGIMAAIFEMFFEKFSIDSLKAFESVAPQTKKDIIKNILKQSITEASEEGLTTIANTITDSLINGDMSSIALQYQQYIKEGYSEEEARSKCAVSLAQQIGLDAAGGAVSGGVLGAGVSTIGYAQGKIDTKIDMKKSSEDIGREAMSSEDFDINLLLEQAKNSSNKKAVSIATAIEKKLNKNENYKVDRVDVGNLMKLISAEDGASVKKSEAKNESVEEILRKADIEEHTKYNFGSAHKNGTGAIDRQGNQVQVIGIESSSKEYGESDNKVRVIAKDGRVYNSESLIFNNQDYNTLMNAAKSFDTHGAGTLVQEYGDYEKFRGKEGSVQEYLTAFSELYEAGKVGGSYGRVSTHKYFTKFINAIGPQRAILAVKAGNKDSDAQFMSEANKLVRVDKRGDVSANVYVEPEAEEILKLDEGARDILEMLSEKTGKEIILTSDIDANGMIDRDNGRIYIRASLEGNYVLPVAIHECMHAIRKENPTDYKLIRDFVVDYLLATGRNIDNMLDEIKANWGERVTSKDDCVEELVCNSVMAIASDEGAMARAVDSVKNKSILERLAKAIKNLAGRIKEFILNHTTNKTARIFAQDAQALERLAEMFSEAADKISGAKNENGQKNNTGEGVKYSMGGLKAETADKTALEQAKELEKNGVDSEQIRKDTGWFKGYDGKWRFEIDDKEFEVSNHPIYSDNKKVLRLEELSNKLLNGEDMSEDERQEFFSLSNDKEAKPKYLYEFVKHDKLFEAYPQLKDMGIAFINLSKYSQTANTNGYYDRNLNEIVIKNTLRLQPKQLKRTLIHEIQHAVQDIENHSNGANQNFWQMQIDNAQSEYEKINTQYERRMDSFIDVLYRYGFTDEDFETTDITTEEGIYKAKEYLARKAPKGAAEIADLLIDTMKNRNAAFANALNLKKRSTSELYEATAGEIEARDTANRLEYNAEQRKNIRPDIDRKDVVFAEGVVKFSVEENENSVEKYSEREKENWKDSRNIILYKDNSQFEDFIEKSLTNEINKKMYLGKISNKLGDFIYNKTGVDITGYNLALRSSEIRKILKKDHGNDAKEKLRGQRAITKSDLLNFVKIVTAPDDVYLESRKYENKPVIIFIKTINGKTTVVTYVSSKHHDLTLQTMYSGKDKGSLATTPSEKNSYSQTSETLSGTASTKSLLQGNNNVNKNFQNNDENIPDIRYIMDDTLNDWLDDFNSDTPKGIDYERVVEKNPVVAVANIYRSAAKTAESGLRQSRSVKLEQKEYLSIAHRIMSNYDIKPKLNPGYAEELAGQLESLVKNAGAKNADFAELFESFVEDCKGGILLSGGFDKTMMKEEREYVLDRIRNKTLLVKERDIQQIEEDYGSVGAYRKKLFGKTNVRVERKGSGGGYYIEDIITDVGDMYPYLLDENADGDMGYLWLENLVNNVLKPKYVNRYVEGEESFYETTDTAAIEMAFNCTAEIIAAKTKKLESDKKADKKMIEELKGPRDEAVKQATEILEVKKKQYKQELEEAKKRNTELWKRNADLSKELKEAHRIRVEHARKMFKRYNEQKAKTRQARDKNASLKHENETYKAIIANEFSSIRAEYNESREKTAYLQRLGRMCDRLTKKLDGKAKNNEYIPDSLKVPVLEVLSCFTVEPVSKYGKRRDTPGYFGEWKRLSEIGERVRELEEQYENLQSKMDPQKLEKMPDSFVDINAIQYKSDVHEQLKNLENMLKGHNIYTLTSVELRAIYETMDLLEQSLKDSVQIILDGKKVSYTAAAGEAINEIRANKKPTTKKLIASAFTHPAKSYFTKHLDPVRFGRFLSNYNEDSVIYKVFAELHRGENEAVRIQQRAINRIKEVTLKYSDKIKNIQSKDVEEFNFVDVGTGNRVPVSQGVLLAVYLTDRQKSGHIHLIGGTDENYIDNYNHYTVLPELKLKNRGQNKTAEEHRPRVRFTPDDLKQIKKYVQGNKMLMELADAVSEVYNETLKQEINRVSMDKYGMKIATVKNYYPLEVDTDAGRFEKSFEAEFFDNRMKSRGFVKKREWSPTPLVINDVLEKFVKQVKTVSEYCGLLIPIENFKKVYNANCGNTTMHAAVKERYGVEAEHYIEKLIGDLQNRPDNSERTMLDNIQGKYMGAKIYGSFSALLQQPSAYPLANRYFGIGNVARAAIGGRRKVDLDKYAQYTPYLWYRKEGNGTVVGELSRKARLTERWYDRFDLIGKMDNLVVGNLLYAAELSVEQEGKLEKGSDAFYREVARRFEKCIDETQPNNMVTSRPELMRNKILRALSLNAFMSQRIAIGNTVMDAGGEMITRINDWKNKKTDESKKAKNKAILKFVSAFSCAVSSTLLNGALKLLATVLIYHRWDDLFDEEGKLSAGNAAVNYLDEVMDGIFGSFAFGDKLYEVVRNIFNKGGNFYGFEVMSLEAIGDMATDLSNGKIWDCIKTLLDCTGLPAANAERLVRSVTAYGNDIINGQGRIISDNKGNINTDYLHYYIVEDKKNGNDSRAEHYERLWKEVLMNDKGKSESEAVDYIKNKLVTALSADENVEDAGIAKANGELARYEEYRQKAIDYGFDSKDVQRAIDRYLTGQAKLAAQEQDEEVRNQKLIENGFSAKGAEYIIGQIKTSEEEEESISAFTETSGENELVMYSYSDAFDALISGDTESYGMIEKYLIEKGGKTKQEIQSAMRSAGRTDRLWAEYIEAATGNDKVRTQELVTQLIRIYGSWENAKTALRRYRERQKAE